MTVFEHGRIVRQELDMNHDGRIDQKIFFEGGRPVRAERDIAGRSDANNWHPDRWEYYEEGRMVRMGTDLDGDGRVDRWDRDAEWLRAREADAAREQAEQVAEDAAEAAAEGDAAEG